MLETKKVGKFNLAASIVLMVTGLLMFFGEWLSYTIYVNSLPEQNMEGLGILLIVVYGLIFGCIVLAMGILNLVCSIMQMKKEGLKVAKVMTIISPIAHLVSVGCLIFWAILMFDLYMSGIILKVIYIGAIALALVAAIRCFCALGKAKKTNE